MYTVKTIHSLGPYMNSYPYFLRCPSDLDIIQVTCTQIMPNDHEFRENWRSESQGRKGIYLTNFHIYFPT
jgi:hypothetical protein